jgi:uncharacterized membrane protein
MEFVAQPNDAAEWRAFSDDPKDGVRTMRWSVVVFALPAVALLVAGGTDAWATLGAAGFVLVGLLIGTIDRWRDRRAVVELRVDPSRLSVRRVDGRRAEYVTAAVERVHVTRREEDPASASLRIHVGGKIVRSRSGPADQADEALGLLTRAGVKVTTRREIPD